MSAAGLPRRTVLAGGLAAAAALSGCLPRSGDAEEPQPLPLRPSAHLESELRQGAADEAAALAQRYESAAARFPRTLLLTRFAADHRAHEAALRPPRSGPATSSASPTAATGQPPGPAPADWVALRRDLVRAERTAAGRRRDGSVTARPELARLLASVSASNAVHAALLEASA